MSKFLILVFFNFEIYWKLVIGNFNISIISALLK